MKSTTTKQRGSNAINTGAKSKRSGSAASISKSAEHNRGTPTNEHNGDSIDSRDPLLASEGGSSILESGANNSTEVGLLVSGEGVELKSASECVFEVGDRVRVVKANDSSLNKQCQDLLGKKGEVISIANCGYWVKVGYREVLFKGENLVKEETKLSPEFEKNYASNFNRSPKAEENGQLNLLECEEDDGEAPDPDDFDNLEAFKTAWDSWKSAQFDEAEEELSNITAEEIWQQSNNGNGSTCAAESVQDSPMPGLNCGENPLTISQSETTIAETSSASDTSTPTSTEMYKTDLEDAEPISSQLRHLVSLSVLMEISSEPTMLETVSPLYSQQSENCSPDSQLSKMSPDCSPVEQDQGMMNPISAASLSIFPRAGTMSNGNVSAANTLQHPGAGKDSLLLRSPGALSGSDGVRPPGKNRLENQLEKLGLIAPGEVCNPEFLETGYQLPQGYSNPAETRTALELSQVQAQDYRSALHPVTAQTAIAVQPSAMPSIGELPLWDSSELSTLPNWGSLNKEELLNYAIASHQIVARIERKEFDLAMMKLEQVNLTGLCLREFKRRCRHGEFESSLEAVGIKPRTAQNYMLIAKNWELVKSKAHSVALLEEGQTLGLNWALKAVTDEKRSLRSAAAPPSDPDNWRTPDTIEQPILFLVKQALGIITVDVCADDAKSVKALVHYTKADDGLSKEWEGYIFMNPPFSNPLPWIQKLCFFRARGDVRGAIALLKAGTINNQGTGELINKHASAICNWRGRIAFLNEDGEPVKGADFDCVLVYFGREPQKFSEVFQPWGTVSLIGNSQLPIANNQQPLTVNSQQLTNIKQEETQAAKALGLSNGKSILPDLRDSNRAASEAHDPHTVPSLIDNNWCKQTAIGVISNAEIFKADQATTVAHALINTDFQTKTKLLVQRLSESQIRAMMAICDDELDRRCSK